MGKFVEDSYIAEFVVDDDIQTVWMRLQEPGEGEPKWLTAYPRFPGSPIAGEILESREPDFVRAKKVAEPCKGTEIAVSLESVENGTKVHVVQSGFPAYVKDALESFRIGGDQIIADMALFLARGVALSRHQKSWTSIGMNFVDVDAGVEVAAITRDTWAERVGLAQGDVLVELNGVPVFNRFEAMGMSRVLAESGEVTAQWVRGNELLEGSAVA